MSKKEVIIYVLILLAIILVRSFVVTPIKVNGDSMNDTLKNGEIMILKKYDKSIERFDIVVVDIGYEKVIKRVIALPKEEFEFKNKQLYINGEKVKNKFGKGNTVDFKDYCGAGEYFVMGDNRENSLDSRSFGCVKKSQILGTTNIVLFPFKKAGKVK